MTQSQKVACRLRWVLLVLWILCLAAGCLYVFGVIGKVGIMGTPAIAIFGLFLPSDGNTDKLFYVFSLIYIGLFVMTQWLFLSPRQMWKIKVKPSGRPMKRAAVGAAFAVTLLSVGLLYSVMDLFSGKFVIDMGTALLRYAFLLIPLALWCFWSVIFCVYWRQSDSYTWAGRVIRGLIAGSVLELIVAVPVYATRQETCYCARGSYAGLVFAGTVLLWAFGPGIFILFAREKQRREKLLEHQKSE
ncbi:MAG: hypothetical protein ABSA64_11545 [Sedimentisphaerales bacterium]|jgi:hypothetical protein